MRSTRNQGYTLVELIVAVGLFALVMTLAAGAYLMMIGISRQTQGITSGIDNVAFALETMMRTIRTGSSYVCPGSTCTTFTLTDAGGKSISYYTGSGASVGAIVQTTNGGSPVQLTDSGSITIDPLKFYTTGLTVGDAQQARVTVVVTGTVTVGSNKPPIPFGVETSATMRTPDL